MGMSVLEFAEKVLGGSVDPLTASDIVEKGEMLGYELDTKSKDKAQNMYCSINQDIRNKDNSRFVGFGKNPKKWGLKKKHSIKTVLSGEIEDDSGEDEEDEISRVNWDERDLHKLLVSYVAGDAYFSCYAKTVFHEKSTKESKGKNHWIHPDIVGIHYPFGISKDQGEFSESTLSLMSKLEHTECRFYSFELKKEITAANLRKWYFEAVSNSSWANEGYLVAAKYDQEIEDEMRKLNDSFGIGFIKLDLEDYTSSEIIIPARRKTDLDWGMIDKLYAGNPDFRNFLNTVQFDMNNKVIRNLKDFDETFSDEKEFQAYIKEKCLWF